MTSIIILSYNTIDYLKICIESIRSFTAKGSYELIVIDNASSDGSAQWISQQSDIHAIYNSENKGFPAGCNQGLEIAKGDDLLLLNSDVVVTPRWLDQLKLALYSSDDIGAVSCVTNNCSNGQQINVPYDNFDINIMLDFAEKFNHSNSNLWIIHFTLVGFCYLFKREIYEAIGGLDEVFSPGNYEDDDYSFRINKLGYKTVLCRDTFVHHFGRSSFVKKRTKEEEEKHTYEYNNLLKRNHKIFCNKWQVNLNYKGFPDYFFEGYKNFSSVGDNLIIGNSRLDYIYYANLFSKLDGRLVNIEYLTDNQTDMDLAGRWFKIHYDKNIIKKLSYLLKTTKYDAIMLTSSFDIELFKQLKKVVQSITYNSKIMIEE